MSGRSARTSIARDEERRVVIENQLDVTDHKHLGQLLVYATDRQAHTVVWIARQVSDEYRKVIDWLNAETSTNFWALEIELWRIGNSAVAPKFNIVCEPNRDHPRVYLAHDVGFEERAHRMRAVPAGSNAG